MQCTATSWTHKEFSLAAQGEFLYLYPSVVSRLSSTPTVLTGLLPETVGAADIEGVKAYSPLEKAMLPG
jgi:hypothetical protein